VKTDEPTMEIRAARRRRNVGVGDAAALIGPIRRIRMKVFVISAKINHRRTDDPSCIRPQKAHVRA